MQGWLVRALDRDTLARFKAESYVAILGGHPSGPTVTDDLTSATQDEIADVVERLGLDTNYSVMLRRAVHEMGVGDMVVSAVSAKQDSTADVLVGKVATGYRYVADATHGLRHQRGVSWSCSLPRSKFRKGFVGGPAALSPVDPDDIPECPPEVGPGWAENR